MPIAFGLASLAWHRRLVRGGSWLGLAVVLLGCAPQRQARSIGSIEVVTTFFPITLFTRAVAGDCARVTAVIPAAVSPHDFQARPADLAALRRARLLIENGLGMESFLDRLVASAAAPQLQRVDTSAGIAPLTAAEEPGHNQEHDHSHGAVNPHIWLDPVRAAQQVATIRDALVKADPACAAGYRRRSATYISQLRALDRELAAQLAPYRGRSFVAFHDIATYFARRYGLKVTSLVDIPETNPSPADLLRVSQLVRASQLKALMSEPQQGERSFNTLARDLGVRIGVFDPLETGSDAAAQDPGTYLRLMRRNGSNLVAAFAG